MESSGEFSCSSLNRSPPRSRKMRELSACNSRDSRNLDKELSRIEQERRNRMRELDKETKHFMEMKTKSHSPTTNGDSISNERKLFSRTATRCRSSSHSPRSFNRIKMEYLGLELTTDLPKKASSTHNVSSSNSSTDYQPISAWSPEIQPKLLSRRNTESFGISNSIFSKELNTTKLAWFPLSSNELQRTGTSHTNDKRNLIHKNKGKLDNIINGIPRIVISDTNMDALPVLHKDNVHSQHPINGHSKNTAGTHFTKPVQHQDDTRLQDVSLTVPMPRVRSNSLPANPHQFKHYKSGNGIREHRNVDNTAQELTDMEAIPHRPRSNTICVPYFKYVKETHRRDSLQRRRITPSLTSRSSKTMDDMMRDLIKGIYNGSMVRDDSSAQTICSEEWKRLKYCRYLRIPGKDETANEGLDMADIFPRPEDNNLIR